MNILYDWVLNNMNVTLTDSQIQKFWDYLKYLHEANKIFNLTAISDLDQIIEKHFIDSLSLGIILNKFNSKLNIIDIGTGAGFPGIPLAIIYEKHNFTLVEANHKKSNFCQNVICDLKLINTHVITSHTSEIKENDKLFNKFDIGVARAVAKLNKLVEITSPFIKQDGILVFPKGKLADSEIEEFSNNNKNKNYKIEKIKLKLPSDTEERAIVVIKKN